MAFSVKSAFKKRTKSKKKHKEIDIHKVTTDKIQSLKENIPLDPTKDHSVDFSGIVKNFFMKLLKIKYHFTHEEFIKEIKRKRLSDELKVDIIQFFQELSDMEFKQEGYTPEDLQRQIKKFENLIPIILKEKNIVKDKPKLSLFAKILSKLHIKKKTSVQEQVHKPKHVPKKIKTLKFHLSFPSFKKSPEDKLAHLYDLVADGYQELGKENLKKSEKILGKIEKIHATLPLELAEEIKKEILTLRKEIKSKQPIPPQKPKFKLPQKLPEMQLPPMPSPEPIKEEPAPPKTALDKIESSKPSFSGFSVKLKDVSKFTKKEETVEPKLEKEKLLMLPAAPMPELKKEEIQIIPKPIKKKKPKSLLIKPQELEKPIEKPVTKPIIKEPIKKPIIKKPIIKEPIVEPVVKLVSEAQAMTEEIFKEPMEELAPPPVPVENLKPIEPKPTMEDLGNLSLTQIRKGDQSFRPKPIFVSSFEKPVQPKQQVSLRTVSKPIEKPIAEKTVRQPRLHLPQIEELENLIQKAQYLISTGNYDAAMETYSKALKVKGSVQISKKESVRISDDLSGIDVDLKLATL